MIDPNLINSPCVHHELHIVIIVEQLNKQKEYTARTTYGSSIHNLAFEMIKVGLGNNNGSVSMSVLAISSYVDVLWCVCAGIDCMGE